MAQNTKSAREYADEVAASLGPQLDKRVSDQVNAILKATGAVRLTDETRRQAALKLAIEARAPTPDGYNPTAAADFIVSAAAKFEAFMKGPPDAT